MAALTGGLFPFVLNTSTAGNHVWHNARFYTAVPASTPTGLQAHYSHLYHKVARRFGTRAPGRNINAQGVRVRYKQHDGRIVHAVRPARPGELGRSIRTFKRWLAPPIPTAHSADVVPTSANTAPVTTGGKFSIPAYIVQCESGGNYNARNASGAYGAYQIMPGTSVAYGCDMSSPAGQDACAAKIYARQGAAPWTCG